MALDFRNCNTLWASVCVESLWYLGLTKAVLCPGSRSAPLTIAFAQHAGIEAISILDERSAAFFALGMAKRMGVFVVVVCTSGTAGANFYPAVIEARESSTPLFVLTADRPPELRYCHAGQAIDQNKLFGHYPKWQTELALPAANLEHLQYLRQTLIHAWEQASHLPAGPVHLNCPFRDPLVPTADPKIQNLQASFPTQQFFRHLPQVKPIGFSKVFKETHDPLPQRTLPKQSTKLSRIPQSPFPIPHSFPQKGLIIVGPTLQHNPEAYCQTIAQLSHHLNWPVLTDALNPLRNHERLNPNLICTYDLLLRNETVATTLQPERVLQLGELPTSKQLRSWLAQLSCDRWVISPHIDNFDPLHGNTIHIPYSLEEFVAWIETVSELDFGLDSGLDSELDSGHNSKSDSVRSYGQLWSDLDHTIQQGINQVMGSIEDLCEPKIPWLLSQSLPPHTPLFIANSTPIRDMEWFWQRNNLFIQPYVNRGANGIDGTLSTALGMAHGAQSSVLLTGDLALLHDTNGFLHTTHLRGHLTIILINNQGGGIFELLPIARFDPPFETYFATPQPIEFAPLCQSYGVDYHAITSWEKLLQVLNPLPKQGVRVLEVKTDRKADATWRLANLPRFANDLLQNDGPLPQ